MSPEHIQTGEVAAAAGGGVLPGHPGGWAQEVGGAFVWLESAAESGVALWVPPSPPQ